MQTRIACALLLVPLAGCFGPHLNGVITDKAGIHFTVKYKGGNWVNTARYTEIVTLPPQTCGKVNHKDVKIHRQDDPRIECTPPVAGYVSYHWPWYLRIRLQNQGWGEGNSLYDYGGNGTYILLFHPSSWW